MAPVSKPAKRPWFAQWIAAWIALVAVELLAATLPGTTPLWTSPLGLFMIVVIAASLCVIAAAAVLVVAHRQNLAELGMIGAFGYAVSVLPLVHGITTPGILYGPNAATMSTVLVALPMASIALVPLLAPRRPWSIALARGWRVFVAVHVLEITALAIALLVRPTLLPAPEMGTTTSIVIAIASLAVCFALSARHLRLSWISRSSQTFVVSIGFAFVGVSSLVWVGKAPFTTGFWLAHAFDIGGVLMLTIGAIAAYRQRRPLQDLVRPLVANEPLSAFALGLDPLVHRFVAALEAKDPITRDHVVRTATLAMSVGEELRLPATDLHLIALGALLHDIGKLDVDDAILNKSGRLDADEYDAIKLHTVRGEQLVAASVVLAPIGPIVRGHHERIDGRGYPDGLVGSAIPLAARIVSVCDAFDAMAHTRQYRSGMGSELATSILREHSGSQWDPTVVTALVSLVERGAVTSSALDDVGRSVDVGPAPFCGCEDALPSELARTSL